MNNYSNKIGGIYFLFIMLFNVFQTDAQVSNNHLLVKGSFLPEGKEYLKMLDAENSNFETILYLSENDEISFETDNGIHYGIDQEGNLVQGGDGITLNVNGDYELFHLHINLNNLSCKVTKVESLGVQTKLTQEEWSKEMDLSVQFEKTAGILSFYLPYSFLLQDQFRLIANHGEELIWNGSIFSNSTQEGLKTKNGKLAEFYFNYFYNDGAASISLNDELSYQVIDAKFNSSIIELLASSYDKEGNRYSIGNCFDCGNDTLGYIQKNNEVKKLFNIRFPSDKRGDFFRVSEDGQRIALIVHNDGNDSIIFDDSTYSSTVENQLVLFILDDNFEVDNTKVLYKSSTPQGIAQDGYDLAIDYNNNIFTQIYLEGSEITIDEVNEPLNYDGVIQIDKWSSEGNHEINNLLYMSNQSNFVTSLMTVDKSDNVYLVVDAENVLYHFSNSSGIGVENNIKAFRFNIAGTNYRNNHNVITTRTSLLTTPATVYSIEGGSDIAYISGSYNRGDIIKYYGNFDATEEDINKGYFIAKLDEFRLDKYMSIYKKEKDEIELSKISLSVDSLDYCNVAFEISSSTEVTMDRRDRRMISTQKSGIGIARFNSLSTIDSYAEFIANNITLKNLDLDVLEDKKVVHGNTSNISSYVKNNTELVEVDQDQNSFEISFDAETYKSNIKKHAFYSVDKLELRGSAFKMEETLELTRSPQNTFTGVALLNKKGGINFMTNNGDTLSIDDQMNLILSDQEYQLEGEEELSLYIINVDLYLHTVELKEIEHISYLPFENETFGTSIELNRADHFKDKKLIKYISDEITLSSEFYFSINNDTTLIIGEGTEINNPLPIRTNEGRKAKLVLYNDYKNGFFSYDIITDLTANINKVKLQAEYDFNSIESDGENIFQLGASFDGNISKLQKLNADGEVLLEEVFDLSAIPEFGNNLKVDPVTGNIVLVLLNKENHSTFTYKGENHTLEEGTRSVVIYLDQDLNLLYVYESKQYTSEISVTIDQDGFAYLSEYDGNLYFKIYKFNDTIFDTLSTIEVERKGNYYINTISVDRHETLYFSAEINVKSLMYNGIELDSFKDKLVNAPLLAINTENGDLRWGKPFIHGGDYGGTGWPTGFQAGDSSIYITGWVLKGDSLLDGSIDTDWLFDGLWSNYITKVNNKGELEWGELLYHDDLSYNYGYTRIHVDKEDNLYYILDLRLDAISSKGNPTLYSNKTVLDEVLLKYNKDGDRIGETRLKPLSQLEDVTTVGEQVVLNGGVAYQNYYLRFQDFTEEYNKEEKSSIILWLDGDYNLSPPKKTEFLVTWAINMKPIIETSLFDPTADTLSLEVFIDGQSSLYFISENDSKGNFSFSTSLPEGEISFGLYINSEKEDIETLRTFTVVNSENEIRVDYKFSNFLNFEEKHIVVEDISEEAIVINIVASLFESLTGNTKNIHLIQKDGDPVPEYVTFDEDILKITIDVTKLPSNQRVKALEDLNLLVVGSDELNNTVAIEIILNLQSYVDQIEDITSINDEIKKSFKVYPTVSEGELNIETHLDNYTLEVIDLNGKVIENKMVNKSIVLDTRSYPKGLLLLKISTDLGNTIYKFIR